nr:hypothetical protein [Tanacetum cinerariifolium]
MGNVKKFIAKRTHHKRQYDRRMKERQMQSKKSKVVSSKALDASLVVTECSGTKSDEHITISNSGTHITQVVDTDIRLVNAQVPSAELHLTALHNVLANKQQHTDQSEPSYDTYLLEKGDSNTTPDFTNMSHMGGEIDQNAKQDQVKITPQYLPKVRESVFLKPNHVIVSGSSRNSSKELYGSNDMAHNYYLDESKKKIQVKIMNLKPSAPLLKEKKGVRFSALYLQKKRNLLVFDNSHLHSTYFPMLIQPLSGSTTPSSMRIAQDTPSTSTSQNTQEAQSYVIPTNVKEDDHGIEVAHMDNDL